MGLQDIFLGGKKRNRVFKNAQRLLTA